jgi:hypothetical protein
MFAILPVSLIDLFLSRQQIPYERIYAHRGVFTPIKCKAHGAERIFHPFVLTLCALRHALCPLLQLLKVVIIDGHKVEDAPSNVKLFTGESKNGPT